MHGVEVKGNERSARGCWAVCICGWMSRVWRGRGAHTKAAGAKWGHLDEVKR